MAQSVCVLVGLKAFVKPTYLCDSSDSSYISDISDSGDSNDQKKVLKKLFLNKKILISIKKNQLKLGKKLNNSNRDTSQLI